MLLSHQCFYLFLSISLFEINKNTCVFFKDDSFEKAVEFFILLKGSQKTRVPSPKLHCLYLLSKPTQMVQGVGLIFHSIPLLQSSSQTGKR